MSLVPLFVMGLCMWWWLFRPKLSACKTSVARGPVRIVRQENFWILWFICYLQLNVTKQTGCGGEAYTALSPVHTRECIGWFAKACWCLSGLQHRILPITNDGAWAAFVPSVADHYRWEQSYAQLACTLIVCLLLVLNGKLDAVISGWEIKTRRHPSEVSVPVVLILCAFLS